MKTFKYRELITFDDQLVGIMQGQYLGDATVVTLKGTVIETIFVAIPRNIAEEAQEKCGSRNDQFKSLSWHFDNKSDRLKLRLVQLYSNVNEHFPEEKYLFRMFRAKDVVEDLQSYNLDVLVNELASEIK